MDFPENLKDHTRKAPAQYMYDLRYVQILLEYQQDFQEWRHIIAVCLQLLEDSEVRVREAISSCTRLLAEQHSAEVVQSMQAPILQSIEHNWVSLLFLHVTPYPSHAHTSGA